MRARLRERQHRQRRCKANQLAPNVVGFIVADLFHHGVPGRDDEAWISRIAADHDPGNDQSQRDTYNEQQDVLDDNLPAFAETASVFQ